MDITQAAWVPDDDPQRDWSVAAALACQWVEGRCSEEGAIGLLVTNTLDNHGVSELEAFKRRHGWTTRRAGRARVGPGRGPVLSYVPYAEDLEFAMRRARGSSIAVVETDAFPLAGWAAQLRAWDLAHDRETPPLPAHLAEAVERLAFYGNNGFGDRFGRDQARRILSELHEPHSVRRLVGALVARGVSARGVKKLGALASSVRY